MAFEEFLREIREKLQSMAGTGCRFESQVIEGLNGTLTHSFLAICEGAKTHPCINMGEYYRQYCAGADMDALAVNILESCRKDIPLSIEAVLDFTCWDFVKSRIFVKLIHTEKNKLLLQKCPNRKYLDLSFVYYVRMEVRELEEYGTIQIYNEHMSCWGVDETELFRMAQKNMQDTGEAVFESIEDILCSFFCAGGTSDMESLEDVPMYVLGNRGRIYGAAQMCNPKALQEAAEIIGGDFWVLPSSIHEVILIPLHHEENGAQGLAEVVKEVNDTKVEPQDILSYHVYRYYKEKGEIIIAA